MNTRMLGDGLVVSAMGFGAMSLSSVYGSADQDESLATLHHAVDAGVTFIDTADVYGAGENERLIGRLLFSRREEVVVATKFGLSGDAASGDVVFRGDAPYVREAVDASLRRLGIDVIDLYYVHRLDPRVPIEETVGAMSELVAAGKVRHLGLSEVNATELRAANAVHQIAAVESEWSIWTRDIEHDVVPTAARLGVGIVPYAPLGRGFLAGAVPSDLEGDDFRRRLERFTRESVAANAVLVTEIRAIATAHDATAAQIALAWLIGKSARFGAPVVPIPGTRRASRIDENLGALRIELTRSEEQTLDGLADRVHGTRGPHT